jgi:hyperosmotically inducible periplasmic protein
MKTTYSILRPLLTYAIMGSLACSAVASEMDDKIEASARNSYVFRTHLKDDAVKVKSDNGKVLLTGTVSNDSNRALAEATVGSLPGVKDVENQITLVGESPAEFSDSWLTLKVNTTLMFHRDVSAIDTKVSTVDGTVTLRGEASSRAQRDLTTEYAGDIKGVKAVKNEMTIATSPAKPRLDLATRIDDASITAQVKTALSLHNSTSAVTTTVHTADGVVTVGGNARNSAEKSLVSKLANDIHGVSKVVNNMSLAPAVTSANK